MKSIVTPLVVYLVTTAIVFAGLHFGARLLKPCTHGAHIFDPEAGAYANWDGQWYSEIASRGYSNEVGNTTSVAFFPGYPLAGRLVKRVTGLPIDLALILVSNGFFLGSLWLMTRYIRMRVPGHELDARTEGYTLLTLAVIPSSFFFRVAYSESMFLFITILTLTAMERRWPLVAIAALIGLATAIRPVGIALIPALLLHAWSISDTTRRKAINIAISAPIAIWGLELYSVYLYYEFGDPLAFSNAQVAWNRHGLVSPINKVLDLFALEPILSIFNPSSVAYWYHHDPHHSLLFSLRLYDAGFFLLAFGLTALGAIRGWLSVREILTSVCLLLVPYCTNGYSTYMNSMGRYSTVAVPIYLVLARGLRSLPEAWASAMVGVSGFFLGAYAALFAAWYVVI